MINRNSYFKFDELGVEDLDAVTVCNKKYIFEVYHSKSNELGSIAELRCLQDSSHFKIIKIVNS